MAAVGLDVIALQLTHPLHALVVEKPKECIQIIEIAEHGALGEPPQLQVFPEALPPQYSIFHRHPLLFLELNSQPVRKNETPPAVRYMSGHQMFGWFLAVAALFSCEAWCPHRRAL